uniref:ScMYB49 protein n=1 Tax=Saccharum hybrid cultivar Co 86032 TaxID=672234 RepID=A0A0C6WCL2_9POAL|nr:ScMYB49 protein [Saccharum hybrid cultivar Co 86032]
MDEAWQQLQDHLVKKEHNKVPENSGSEIGSLLEELDDLIVDPYESQDEDEQKLSEHIGQTDVDNDHCNGSSQTSIEVTSNMVPEEMMEDCPVDNCKEDSSLCKNVLSESTEPCPGAKIPACGNLSEDQVAEDSMLQRVESTSPCYNRYWRAVVRGSRRGGWGR